MILLDRVTKVYNRKTGSALERINLHVEPKEFVIVVGPSGAGKSTLLKLLTREEKPSSGKIIVGGIDYDKLKDLRTKHESSDPDKVLDGDLGDLISSYQEHDLAG